MNQWKKSRTNFRLKDVPTSVDFVSCLGIMHARNNNGVALEDQRIEKTFTTSLAQGLSYHLNLVEMTILRRKVR